MKKVLILASTDTTFSSTSIASYAADKIGQPVLSPVTAPIYRKDYDTLDANTLAHDILEAVRPREDIPSQIIIMENDNEFFNVVKGIIDEDLNTTGKVYDGYGAVSGQMAIWTI